MNHTISSSSHTELLIYAGGCSVELRRRGSDLPPRRRWSATDHDVTSSPDLRDWSPSRDDHSASSVSIVSSANGSPTSLSLDWLQTTATGRASPQYVSRYCPAAWLLCPRYRRIHLNFVSATRKLSSIERRGPTDRVSNWDPNSNPNLDFWPWPSFQW